MTATGTDSNGHEANDTDSKGQSVACIIVVALLLSGCAAARKPVAPKPFKQGSAWSCGTDSWVAVFAKGNSGKIICIPNTGVQTGVEHRDLHPPAPYCDGKNPCKCEPSSNWKYSEYQQRCEAR